MKRNRKGFTLVEVLVAILIISVASAALAASVNSASNMNATGLKIDSDYKHDLSDANNQTSGTGSEGNVSFGDNEDYSHNVYVFGDGDLSTASGNVGNPEGGTTGEYTQGVHVRENEKEIEDYVVKETDDPLKNLGSVHLKDFRRGDVVVTYEDILIIGFLKDLFTRQGADRLYFVTLEDDISHWGVGDDGLVKLAANNDNYVFNYVDPLTGNTLTIHSLWNITTYITDDRYKMTSTQFDDMIDEKGYFVEGTIVYKSIKDTEKGNYYICTYTHQASDSDYLFLENDGSFDAWVKLNK